MANTSEFSVPPQTDPGAPPRAWPPPRRKITEPLVVAFAASAMKDSVGPDALREVLSFSMVEMTRTPGIVHLGPLWEILKKQPGFTAEKGAEPLARYKSFELSLGYHVQLPDELATWPGQMLDAAASRAPVSSLALLEALDPPKTPSGRNAVIKDKAPPPKPKSSIGLTIGLVLVLGVASLFGMPYVLDAMENQSLDVASISTSMRLRSARVLDDAVEITLLDDDWVKSKDREATLKDALANAVKLEGVTKVSVVDSKGQVRAFALKMNDTVRTTFLD